MHDDPPSLSQRIAAELRDEILRGRYRTGDRLPSERELAERFATHRGTVREAFKKLEQLGVAEIRRGGARAAPIENASLDVVRHLMELDQPPDPVMFDQIFEAFGGLFSLAAHLAAERADDEQRERARAILETLMEDELPVAEEHQLIHTLSELFVEASGNMILALVRRGLQTRVIERIENHQELLRPPAPQRRPLLQRIAKAIAERDGPGASIAVFEMSQAVRRNAVELLTAERERRRIAEAIGVSRP
jgi:GntR family transcriptional repressor for pyruvate dehydrogenase complex